MTVAEFLESLRQDKREMMAEFLYSRTPCKYILPSISPEPLAKDYVKSLPLVRQRTALSFGRL
jgi:hypothetical protein